MPSTSVQKEREIERGDVNKFADALQGEQRIFLLILCLIALRSSYAIIKQPGLVIRDHRAVDYITHTTEYSVRSSPSVLCNSEDQLHEQ